MTVPSDDGSTAKPIYDVAISFLAKDENVAAELNDRLVGLRVFFFPRKQEELAGTDGLDSMREPFLSARVVVILYCEPWGKTNWTRIEESAIKDRCLDKGWTGLQFVVLDKRAALPTWLPHTHIRFCFEDYGIEQLVGAVKAKVQEAGGTIERPTAMSNALRVHRETVLREEQQRLFHDQRWIMETLHPVVVELMQKIVVVADEIRQTTGMDFQALTREKRCILRGGRISLNVGWRQQYINVVDEHCALQVSEFTSPVFFPEERRMVLGEVKERSRRNFLPVLSTSREVRWVEKAKETEHLSADDMANRVVTLFIDFLDRANKGEIEFPSW